MGMTPNELDTTPCADLWRAASFRVEHEVDMLRVKADVEFKAAAFVGSLWVDEMPPDRLYTAWTGRAWDTGELLDDEALREMFDAPRGQSQGSLAEAMIKQALTENGEA